MNKNDFIRSACLAAKSKGINVIRGPWFEISNNKIKSCCAIGAVLLTDENFSLAENPSSPGYVKRACQLLEVDPSWLVRFWMGFDRGHHVTLVNKDVESKDDVSAFGIQLAKEVVDSK